MMYKHSLNIVPKYISMMFQKNNEIHKHNTRKCNSLHSSVGKLETTYKSFSFHAINIWNYMLRHVPIHISYESFKRLTKVHIQENNIYYRISTSYIKSRFELFKKRFSTVLHASYHHKIDYYL